MSTSCRGCGESIDFVATPAGKKMPVNSGRTAVVVDGRHGPLKFVRDTGEVVSSRLATDAERALANAPGSLVEFLRAPHWSSCKGAERFRAKGRTAP